MPSILLVDDDPNLSDLLAEYLRGQGFTVHCASDGHEGFQAFLDQRPDLIVLDVSMPVRDGWSTLKRIRDLGRTPVIMLTARSDEADVLRGFSLGADDYISKPFSFAQLGARARAILARSGGNPSSSEHLVAGELRVDLATRRVTRRNELIPLTPTEFKLLIALMRRPGEVISAGELVREVWGPQFANEIGFVRRYIWHLRQKVEPDPENPKFIHNERGFGYRFEAAQ